MMPCITFIVYVVPALRPDTSIDVLRPADRSAVPSFRTSYSVTGLVLLVSGAAKLNVNDWSFTFDFESTEGAREAVAAVVSAEAKVAETRRSMVSGRRQHVQISHVGRVAWAKH